MMENKNLKQSDRTVKISQHRYEQLLDNSFYIMFFPFILHTVVYKKRIYAYYHVPSIRFLVLLHIKIKRRLCYEEF